MSNRLKKLEDYFGVGVCPRCQDLPRLEIRFLDRGEDLDRTDAPPICPECGKREPPCQLVIFQAREDGPQ